MPEIVRELPHNYVFKKPRKKELRQESCYSSILDLIEVAEKKAILRTFHSNIP